VRRGQSEDLAATRGNGSTFGRKATPPPTGRVGAAPLVGRTWAGGSSQESGMDPEGKTYMAQGMRQRQQARKHAAVGLFQSDDLAWERWERPLDLKFRCHAGFALSYAADLQLYAGWAVVNTHRERTALGNYGAAPNSPTGRCARATLLGLLHD
jgi:hypothetical protein